MWTIDELREQVERALGAADYDGPASGRVRAVPDRRTIRYYTTLGLIDRPARMQGRTALYDLRHLQQLAAIKRLQADGLSLTEVQQRLAGASAAQLGSLARLPPLSPPPRLAPARAQSFWKREAAPPEPAAEAAAEVSPAPTPELRAAVELAPGLTVVFAHDRMPTPSDAVALARAAAPLIQQLRARGLFDPHNPSGE